MVCDDIRRLTMKPVVKGLLIGCSVLLVLAIVLVVAVGFFVKSKSSDLIARGKEMRTEGETFGRGVSESMCVSEAMRRYSADRGMISGVKQRLWLAGCLETSTFEPSFCASIPPQSELMRSAEWRVKQCATFGMSGDSTCPNVLAEVPTYCGGAGRQKKTP